jgi:predicted nucleotidyltransferase component of viral defense system
MTKKFHSSYIAQVGMLIEIIPYINSNENFAIKGGTAINLFLFDLPRLSVDIDLCYTSLTPRENALREIRSFVHDLAVQLNGIGFKIKRKKTVEGYESTLFIQFKNAEVKVEINRVIRGSVHKPVVQSLVASAVEQFKRNVSVLCLDRNDLFGGKICAALDRQHPRDFFDLYIFFKNFSYTRELHQTFMVYLLSSVRPIAELINPNYIDMRERYNNQFEGMSILDITCEDLEKTRDELFALVTGFFNDEEKEFLLSFKAGQPKWDLFPIENARYFPAIQWKLHNILSMNPEKRLAALNKLESKLLT